MSSPEDGGPPPQLSVIIPSFNSAQWLPSTLAALADAVREADLLVEVIVVDDGSTDGTPETVAAAASAFPGVLRVVKQENKGRFLARWEGLMRASADTVLLLDSRVLIGRGALRHVIDGRSASAWNASVVTDRRSPLVGLFWEVPTHVFWGRYLRSPQPIDITVENFDRVPKGTTMFLASKAILVEAFTNAWPQGDARLVSDDTKVLRHIAATATMRLDPGFNATYRPRTTLRGFVRHTFDRGTLFVDSYAGTSAMRSIILILLALSPVILVAVLAALTLMGLAAVAVWAVVACVLVAVLLPSVVAAYNRCPGRSIVAYVVILPLFVVPFWLGLVRGAVMHRKSFVPTARTSEGTAPGTELR